MNTVNTIKQKSIKAVLKKSDSTYIIYQFYEMK